MNTENMTAAELIEYALQNPLPSKPYIRSIEQDNREQFYREEDNKTMQGIIKALENTLCRSATAET
jgi:hypothetical protein